MSSMAYLMGLFGPGTGNDIQVDDPEYYNPPFENFDIKYKGKETLPKRMTLTPYQMNENKFNFMFRSDGQDECPTFNK